MSDRVPDYYGAEPCACGYNKADPDGYCHWCRGAEMREEFECNKKCFDELGAQLALAHNQTQTLKQYMWKHQEQRYYWCKNCKCYHLTSQPEAKDV